MRKPQIGQIARHLSLVLSSRWLSLVLEEVRFPSFSKSRQFSLSPGKEDTPDDGITLTKQHSANARSYSERKYAALFLKYALGFLPEGLKVKRILLFLF